MSQAYPINFLNVIKHRGAAAMIAADWVQALSLRQLTLLIPWS
ncbi:hypothetical protein [Leptothermofonsia sichuanensis]|nr:hypothetical protein [Leptothermofonsia sichuanensis]